MRRTARVKHDIKPWHFLRQSSEAPVSASILRVRPVFTIKRRVVDDDERRGRVEEFCRKPEMVENQISPSYSSSRARRETRPHSWIPLVVPG